MEEQAKIRFLIRTAYFVTVVAGTVLLCRFAFAYFFPFLLGALVAWAVQKPAGFFSRRIGVKKRTAALILAVLLFLAVAALLVLLLYRGSIALGNVLAGLTEKLPDMGNAFAKIKDGIEGFFRQMPKEVSLTAQTFLQGAGQRLLNLLTNTLSNFVTGFLKKLPMFLLYTLVALAASCYMALDFDKLARFLKGVIGRQAYEKLDKIKEICKKSLFKLIKGYFFLSLISMILLLIGFLVLGIRYALLAAILIAAVDFLPVLGTGVVLIPWGITSLLLSDIRTGAGLLILYAVIAVVRYFAEPKVVGGQTGINPLFMLAAMFVGLKFIGGIGLFLAPMALIVTVEYYKAELQTEKTT